MNEKLFAHHASSLLAKRMGLGSWTITCCKLTPTLAILCFSQTNVTS